MTAEERAREKQEQEREQNRERLTAFGAATCVETASKQVEHELWTACRTDLADYTRYSVTWTEDRGTTDDGGILTRHPAQTYGVVGDELVVYRESEPLYLDGESISPWSIMMLFDDGELVFSESFGHGKTETGEWHPKEAALDNWTSRGPLLIELGTSL